MKIYGAIYLILFSVNVLASSLPEFPFVTVTGESVRKVEPDTARITFNLVTFNKDAEQAKQTLFVASNDVVKTIGKHNIDTKDITSYEISKQAKRERNKGYNTLDILGYEFTQRIEVQINDIERYVDLTTDLLSASNLENIQSRFEYSKRDSVETELIAEAAKKAKDKAKQMAKGLDVKIGSVFAFNDTGSFTSFFATFGIDSSRNMPYRAMSAEQSRSSNLFVPQYIEISKSVNVIYKLDN